MKTLITSMILGSSILYGCGPNSTLPATGASSFDELSVKDRGLIAKCSGGVVDKTNVEIFAGIREKSLGASASLSRSTVGKIVSDNPLVTTNEQALEWYDKYRDCLIQNDPELAFLEGEKKNSLS